MNYKIVLTIGERIVGVIEVDPNEAMIDRDEQTPPHPVYRNWYAKQDAKQFIAGMPVRPLTIPSICLDEPASHMSMLGGEFGGLE